MITAPDIEDAAARFRQAVLADPACHERLGRHAELESFEKEVHAIAAALGIDPAAAISLADLQPDPLGLARFQPAPVNLDHWPHPGWLPVRSAGGVGAPAFDWAWFGSRALTEPLFEDSVRRVESRPFSRAFRTRTGIDALIDGACRGGGADPDGLIFHMSRCGSTLAAQVLASVPGHHVVSEPEPLDAVLRWAVTSGAPHATQVAAVRALVRALGNGQGGAVRRYFIKLDSWHIHALPLLRAAFPRVPWLFLYRNPDEVMVSHLEMPGVFATTPEGVARARSPALPRPGSAQDECADALGQFLNAAAEHFGNGGGMLLDYADLRAALGSAIPTHFGFTPDPGEAEAMAAAALRDAKVPDKRFVDDRARKRALVTSAIQAAVATYLSEPYARLEALRSAGLAGTGSRS